MSPSIFISYKAEEFYQADWVKKRLEAAGFSCWMAPASIPGGSNYAIQIPKAISACKYFVVVLSSRAQMSKWVPRELDQAINAGKVILPFIIENCPLREDFSFYLSNVQHYNAWINPEKAVAELIGDITADLTGQAAIIEKPIPSGTGRRAPWPWGRFTRGKQPGRNGISHGGKRKGLHLTISIAVTISLVAFLCTCAYVWLFSPQKIISESGNVPSANESQGGESAEGSGDSQPTANESQAPENETGRPGAGIGEIAYEAEDEPRAAQPPNNSSNTSKARGDREDSAAEAIDYNTDGEVRILNKKYAQDAEFQHLAREFEKESGIQVTVTSPAVSAYSEVLEESITGSRNDPTLFMLTGLNDFEEYGGECLDLTGCPAAGELVDDSYTLRGQNGKVYGLACIVESYGLCVNTRLLEKAGYAISDIQSFTDLKRIARDITRRKDELGFSAFTAPSVGIGVSGDYRFAEHAPAVPLYYELKENDFNIRLKLHGTYMDCFRDYIDLYLDNATVARSEAAVKSIEEAQEEFLAGKAVFHQDGSWDLEKIEDVMEEDGAVIPLYMGMPGEEKQGLNKTCSYYWCVNKYASEDDIEATLQFLQWAVTSRTGIKIMTRDMGFQIPYRESEVPDNIFLQVLDEGEKEGYESISQYYKYGDYNTWVDSIRKTLREYADGSGSWSAVEEAFRSLW